MYKLADSGKPREKLLAYGPANLTDKELMAVILGSGIRGRRIDILAEDVLSALDGCDFRIDTQKLLALPGMGTAKVSLLAAALELTKRFSNEQQIKIQTPEDAFQVIKHMADRQREHFLCLSLNGAYEVTHKHIVSIGLLNRTMVHPREVYSQAITDRAAAIICAHNHPSGNVLPSQEDRTITRRLINAGKLLGIQLLDHIIFTPGQYFSFQARGML